MLNIPAELDVRQVAISIAKQSFSFWIKSQPRARAISCKCKTDHRRRLGLYARTKQLPFFHFHSQGNKNAICYARKQHTNDCALVPNTYACVWNTRTLHVREYNYMFVNTSFRYKKRYWMKTRSKRRAVCFDACGCILGIRSTLPRASIS